MLYSLLLLVAVLSVISATFVSYSYMTSGLFVQQYQHALAQGNGDSDDSMDEPESSTVGPPEEESGKPSDDSGVTEIGAAPRSEDGIDGDDDDSGRDGNTTAFQTNIYRESDEEQNSLANSSGDQNTTQPDRKLCTGDFALDPTTGDCDSTLGPCPEGETRGESGFCAVMPKECPPGTYIDEDPFCEPCPTEGQIPEECDQLDKIEPPTPIAEPIPLSNETTANQTGNTTYVTINNAIAQAFSSTTYNTKVLQQAAQNTLLVGEETVPLRGQIMANDTRLLSTFEPFKLIGGSAIIHLSTSNISSSDLASHSDEMRILGLDGDSDEVIPLPTTNIPIQGIGHVYKTTLGEAFVGTNPFTGQQVTVDNIKALFLFNGINQTITFGYGSNVALLTIVR